MAKTCFASLGAGTLGGSFLFRAGGIFLKVRLRARLVGGGRNDTRVVPFRAKDTFLWEVQIYPPSSVAVATASPQGEAFSEFLSLSITS